MIDYQGASGYRIVLEDPVPGATSVGAIGVRGRKIAAAGPHAMALALVKAFELYKSGAAQKLLVTGGFTRDYISEARMMKIALVTYGVAPDDVLQEELAATTIENGVFAARMFDARGEHRRLAEVGRAYAGTSAIVVTTAGAGEHLAPESAPAWKVASVN